VPAACDRCNRGGFRCEEQVVSVKEETMRRPPVATTDSSGSQPGYGIGALARRLGVAPATLRDWERRYGIGPGGRSAGGHRRYQPADIARIEYMRRLVLDGMPPGDAARAALASEAGPVTEVMAQAPAAEPELAAWGAGGRSLPLPGQLPQARGLARAALALDGGAIAGLLDRALGSGGVVTTWERLAMPVLTAVGERSAADGTCIDVEHLLSAQLLAALSARAGRLAEPRNARTVLLACADGEEHSLPLYALAAALAERDVRTTMLGARVPPSALANTISRIGPAAAFVWSQTTATGDPAKLAGIARQRPPLRLFTAGPGWRGTPPGGSAVSSLPEAVQLACEAVGLA
jgi:MerR family transcriptional regulator, light-induced transcriptional regulator